MGHNRRAEEREYRARLKAGRTHFIVISWKTHLGDWLVNFLDPRSRLPLGKQRVYSSADPIRGMVSRSITNPQGGPKFILFTKALEAGKGEIEIEISDEQLQRVRGKPLS